MIATAFLSMWISNTATSVMMLPIGLAIIKQLKDNPDTDEDENLIFGKALPGRGPSSKPTWSTYS